MTGEVDLQKYTDWFVWARDNLGRELDPTHAAAEAAYRSAAEGGSDDDAEAAARAAGAEPGPVDPATMALAEWAAWALATGRFRPDQGLIVARHALAEVEASHDLDATINDVLYVAPPAAAADVSASTPRRRNALIVVGAVVGLVVVGAATAGIISGISNLGGSAPASRPSFNPTVQAHLQPDGQARIVGSGFPPNTTVFVIVDSEVHPAQTDAGGTVVATIAVAIGGHNVSVCYDYAGTSCPASTFISRDQ